MRPARSLPRLLLLGALASALAPASPSVAAEYGKDARVGVDEKVGTTVPLDAVFRDEEGKDVRLGDLIRRPTVLTLVYLRCPNICSPLMHEVAKKVEQVDLVPGTDYDLITVSFDDRETAELAATAKRNLLGGMSKVVPPEAWRFLTGDAENIVRLTDAVGFRFQREGEDFKHAATVVFLTKDGKVVRYLGGLVLLPMDLKMAVLDAAEGRTRTLMQRVQTLCFSYDPEGKTYVFRVNRIVLAATLLALGGFGLWLLLRRRGASAGAGPAATALGAPAGRMDR